MPATGPAPTATPGVGAAAATDTAGVPGTPVSTPAAAAPAPASGWGTVWGVLFGVVIGVIAAWLWARRSAGTSRRHERASYPATPPALPAPETRKQGENVWAVPPRPATEPSGAAKAAAAAASAPVVPGEGADKGISAQPMRAVPGAPNATPPAGSLSKKNKQKYNSRGPAAGLVAGASSGSNRPSAMNPSSPTTPPAESDQPLEAGQTIEWAAPTSTPPAIQELIEQSAPAVSAEVAATAAAPAPAHGPLHYYAPAPDVPSIEHRKLSPNPLPQMPLLITLPQVEATTAQFSFSPQADQSRIIGNGVRELKEFFQFELPPTEQFTSIKNLQPGRLEKRDDAWHVVQKAEIALS